ncbi:MAG TPA: CBS domain-containing protein, partial [Chitinophagaceae bacterium]|nr:CBS domain-containing protein [Chitinophagaceae bacterium]
DLRRMLEKNDQFLNLAAKDIVTTNPKTISPETMAVQALEVFKTFDITHLIVTENNQYLGILHLHDLLREGIV